jgi:MFS family permease
MAMGGVVGGWMNDLVGWRWAFGAQVPLTAVASIVVYFTVNLPVKKTEGSRLKRIDFLGAISLVSFLLLLLLGLNSGGNVVPWSHPLIITAFSLSALSLVLFVYIEKKIAPEPVIPIDQLLKRTVLAACFTNWFCLMAFYGFQYYMPIYFQIRGDSTGTAGSKLVPMSAGIAFGSILAGIAMRRWGKYYWLNVVSMTMFLAAHAFETTIQINSSYWPSMIAFFLIGFTIASMLTITITALIASIDHKYQAVISSAVFAFRNTGSTIGITICSAVFHNVLRTQLWEVLGDRDGADEILPKIRDSLDYIKELPPSWKEPVLEICMQALRAVFITLFGVATMGALVSFFMKEHRLYNNLARRDSNA